MKPRQLSISVLLAAMLAVSGLYLSSTAPRVATAAEALPVSELSADRYAQHVAYLASDEMKGRGNGSPELERAGDYIAAQFRLIGLRPGGDDNSWFQKFQITTGAELGQKNALQVDGKSLKASSDFVTILFSPATEVDAPAVFAG